MQGGKYLAEERGAFEVEAAQSRTEDAILPACAPLYEVAAIHDGQPALDWLRVFMTAWSEE